jgi:hypothetical protein
MNRWKLSLLFLLFIRLSAHAQISLIDYDHLLANLSMNEDSEVTYDHLYQTLNYYSDHPLSLNLTDKAELMSLRLLTSAQIDDILVYRAQYGPFLSLFELQVIPNLDEQRINQLLPFLTVSNAPKINNSLISSLKNSTERFLLIRHGQSLQVADGYRDTTAGYIGNRTNLLVKVHISNGNDYGIDFTAEKDSGEPFGWQKNQKGFDYYSGYLRLQNKGILTNLILGDYQVQTGQGLVYGAGYYPGKGRETVTASYRNSLGARPYHSVAETGFFRGLSATIGKSSLNVSIYASGLAEDAQLNLDSTRSETYVNSLQTSGLHRTSKQIQAKNSIKTYSFGGSIHYQPKRAIKLGASYLYTQYSQIILPLNTTYQLNAFSGDRHQLGSIYFDWNIQNFLVFGEGALTMSGNGGLVTGLIASLTPKIDLSLVYPKYGEHFNSFYGHGFGENSNNTNEQGAYWGLKFTPNKKNKLSVYYDYFRFESFQYQLYGPSDGIEYLGAYEFTPTSAVRFLLQYRYEQKPLSITQLDQKLRTVIQRKKHNYRISIQKNINNGFVLKTTVQWSTTAQSSIKKTGFAAMQDLNFQYQKMKISTRIALFETDDYGNMRMNEMFALVSKYPPTKITVSGPIYSLHTRSTETLHFG